MVVSAFFTIPKWELLPEATLRSDIDAEIKKLQTALISQEDYQKLQNK